MCNQYCYFRRRERYEMDHKNMKKLYFKLIIFFLFITGFTYTFTVTGAMGKFSVFGTVFCQVSFVFLCVIIMIFIIEQLKYHFSNNSSDK